MDIKKRDGNIKNLGESIFSLKNNLSSLDKIFNKRNKYIYVLILIIGIILLTFPGLDSDGKIDNSSTDEERLCNILSQIQGCGDVSAMITYSEPEKYGDKKGKALGAIIVYGGLDNQEVQIKISEAAQAALDLPPHKVKVYKSE